MKTKRFLIVTSLLLMGLAAGIATHQKLNWKSPIMLSDGSDPAPVPVPPFHANRANLNPPVPISPALYADGSDPAPPHGKSSDSGQSSPDNSGPTLPDHPAHPSQPTPPVPLTSLA